MKRKDFLKRSLATLGAVAVAPIVHTCQTSDVEPGGLDGAGAESGDCVMTPSETEGPFPTKNPSSLSLVDIRADRVGVPMSIDITIVNKNDGCEPIAGAIVDIWHCDAEGNYSEYGGTGMQVVNYTAEHFLRGRQVTDEQGLASFLSIFPGWYPSRAPHIHVHIYDKWGKSLLITQIAFPEQVSNEVYTTATTFYTEGTQDTANSRDNIFSDGYDEELAAITGDVENGFQLTHTIVVDA